MGGIEPGDAATWVGALFAAAAAYGALGTLKSQRQQIAEQRSFIEAQLEVLELQRQELTGTLGDRAYAQARLVRATFRTEPRTHWVAHDGQSGVTVPARPYPGSADAEPYVGHVVRVHVSNRSDAPIYDVSVHIGSYEEGPRRPHERLHDGLADIISAHFTEDLQTKHAIAAYDEGIFFTGPIWRPQWINEHHITFRDTSDRSWCLDAHGALSPIRSP